MHNENHQWHKKEICKWRVKLFDPCLDSSGSGKELSMFDKLDVRQSVSTSIYTILVEDLRNK